MKTYKYFKFSRSFDLARECGRRLIQCNKLRMQCGRYGVSGCLSVFSSKSKVKSFPARLGSVYSSAFAHGSREAPCLPAHAKRPQERPGLFLAEHSPHLLSKELPAVVGHTHPTVEAVKVH